MVYAPVISLQRSRCHIRERGDQWLAAGGDEHRARDHTMPVSYCLHREISHRSVRALNHHQRTRHVTWRVVMPAGDGPDAVLAGRANAVVGDYFAAMEGGFAEEIVAV